MNREPTPEQRPLTLKEEREASHKRMDAIRAEEFKRVRFAEERFDFGFLCGERTRVNP